MVRTTLFAKNVKTGKKVTFEKIHNSFSKIFASSVLMKRCSIIIKKPSGREIIYLRQKEVLDIFRTSFWQCIVSVVRSLAKMWLRSESIQNLGYFCCYFSITNTFVWLGSERVKKNVISNLQKILYGARTTYRWFDLYLEVKRYFHNSKVLVVFTACPG